MSDDQINAVIAEVCGWTRIDQERNGKFAGRKPTEDGPGYCSFYVPTYTHDLNAMHEAESTMTQAQWAYFVAKLAELTRQPGRCDIPAQILLQATARQRAEAFLKAVEKWEDSK
jgi:hypothetical protein